MALDVDKLQAGLDDYRKNLGRQREQLRGNFDDLQHLFDALFASYGGQMAEEFRQHWGNTAEWFEEYIESAQRLDTFLESRIDQLRSL